MTGGIVRRGRVTGDGKRATLPHDAIEIDEQVIGDIRPAPLRAHVEGLNPLQIGRGVRRTVPRRRSRVMERHPRDRVLAQTWPGWGRTPGEARLHKRRLLI